ncbi:MAG: electron transfer flavoprotein-ubiquinone oxidoreductase [Candidatus Xenobia bacterium]
MSEREVLEVDVLFVGGGPGNLSGAVKLQRLLNAAGKEAMVAVIEKGSEIGAHALSGAVLDPIALRELEPDFLAKGAPVTCEVKSEDIYMLTDSGQLKVPMVPPPMRNHGNYIISLGSLVRWLAKMAEEAGVNLFPGFAGVDLLVEDGKVVGVRTGDKGLNKQGQPGENYEQGIDIRAKVTVLGEGPLGTLTRIAQQRLGIQEGKNPQSYATGVKEIWEMPKGRTQPGSIIHTMGWPLDVHTFGGGFCYHDDKDRIAIGLVVGLDYADPYLDPHREFQRMKEHPLFKPMLEGGKLVHYGAKTIPEGGFYSVPRLASPGLLILGDSAAMVNVPKLKGIHYAMKAGLCAAETIMEAIAADDFSQAKLEAYSRRVENSYIWTDLKATRYFKEYFADGLFVGLMKSGISFYTNGNFPKGTGKGHADYKGMRKIQDLYPSGAPAHAEPRRFDKTLTFPKLDDVYFSGTRHNEKQASHLIVHDFDLCRTKCKEEYGNPCERFCPASVYEMVPDGDGKKLMVNFSNCVHCKTCDIKDPYNNILWTPPEGGDGPNYVNL